jgi:hypothetical protein
MCFLRENPVSTYKCQWGFAAQKVPYCWENGEQGGRAQGTLEAQYLQVQAVVWCVPEISSFCALPPPCHFPGLAHVQEVGVHWAPVCVQGGRRAHGWRNSGSLFPLLNSDSPCDLGHLHTLLACADFQKKIALPGGSEAAEVKRWCWPGQRFREC